MIYQPQRNIHLYRLTNDAENYTVREEGIFQVRYSKGDNLFETLIGAFNFYITLEDEASIYDITEGERLVEVKKYLN
jgi:hypothetical protein